MNKRQRRRQLERRRLPVLMKKRWKQFVRDGVRTFQGFVTIDTFVTVTSG